MGHPYLDTQVGPRNSPGSGRWCRRPGRRSRHCDRPDHCGCSLGRRWCHHSGTQGHPQVPRGAWRGDRTALTTAMGQPRLGLTVCSPLPADTGCAGLRLPASTLGPGLPQSPAVSRSRAAFTRLQLPHPGLQLLVLGERGGGESRRCWLSSAPSDTPRRFVARGA